MNSKYIPRVAKKLANLQFAISLLFSIGLIIAIGTLIEQDQTLEFYKENYAETSAMFGFLTWKWIIFFTLDRIYTSWWFNILLILFAASLFSCTLTTQLPSIKSFKIWKFYKKPKQFSQANIKNDLNQSLFSSFAYQCNEINYHFFSQDNAGYAYSGLLGRVAPSIVHLSIILLLLGSTAGSFFGYTAQQFIPRGEITHLQNLTKIGPSSLFTQDLSFRVNDFWITYTKDLKTDQFYSDLSLLNNEGKEITRKTIFVNEPLTYKNTLIYQTDWDLVGLKVKLNNGKIFQLPAKKVTKGNRKFWFCSIPSNQNAEKKNSVIINDLNGQLAIYDSKGALLRKATVGDFLTFESDFTLQFISFLTTTGLQAKSDPGIQTVYLSFLLLMISIYVSFFTYSQIWLLTRPNKIFVGGNSNRAVLFFQQQFRKTINQVAKGIK